MRRIIQRGFLKGESEEIARFLHDGNSSLDKVKLGMLLSEKGDIYTQVLEAFIGQMDFYLYDFDLAIRKLLFTFRLPAEAQKIDRIVQVWSSHWHKMNPGVFPEAKCAYVLAYAIIMLNTDAHNEIVHRKMTLKEFITNISHNNGGELIPVKLLEEIYPRIVEEELKMEDEGALFPTASKKGWILVRSGRPFHLWKNRWIILTPTALHIMKRIGDHNPLRSISRGNLLLNRPVQEQGKKFLLFLYHSPAQADPDSVDIDSEKQVMDLNERAVTVFCATEKEVIDSWVASITKSFRSVSSSKKLSCTNF